MPRRPLLLAGFVPGAILLGAALLLTYPRTEPTREAPRLPRASGCAVARGTAAVPSGPAARLPQPGAVGSNGSVSSSREILDLTPPPADARLPYGLEPNQFGDLRLPGAARSLSDPRVPVVVVIHGGFWRAAYSLEHIGHLAAALTAGGIATWSLEYRRLGQPGGGYPGTFLDVADATDFLRILADRYPLDLSRVAVVGHSAGGHLAAWVSLRHRLPPGDPLARANPLPVRGAVPLAGVVDLVLGSRLGLSSGVVDQLMGGSPSTVPERYATGSPAALLPAGSVITQVLVHGEDDEIVPIQVSRSYVESGRSQQDAISLVALPGIGHFELIDPRSAAWPDVLCGVEQVLRPAP